MFNLQLGVGIGVYNVNTTGLFGAELGFAVTPDRRGYLILPFQVQFSSGTTVIIVPLGFEYDVPITIGSIKNLYLTPRLAVGYASLQVTGVDTLNGGYLAIEGGAKYVFRGRWNFGFDPVSLAVLFFGDNFQHVAAAVSYRLYVYVGLNF